MWVNAFTVLVVFLQKLVNMKSLICTLLVFTSLSAFGGNTDIGSMSEYRKSISKAIEAQNCATFFINLMWMESELNVEPSDTAKIKAEKKHLKALSDESQALDSRLSAKDRALLEKSTEEDACAGAVLDESDLQEKSANRRKEIKRCADSKNKGMSIMMSFGKLKSLSAVAPACAKFNNIKVKTITF